MKALDYQSVKPNTKPLSDENKLDIKQPTQLKQLKLNEIPKPLWITLSRKDFNSLVKDVVDNLDSEDYKTTANNHKYSLKNAERFLLEIINKKTNENEAWKLYRHCCFKNQTLLF